MATTAGASLLGQVLGILTNKILAVTMGPAGVGFYGLYRQLLDMWSAAASIGSAGGLLQGLSATEGEARLRRLKAALVLNVVAIGLSAAALVVLAPILAEKYFVGADPHVAQVVAWLGIPIALGQIAMIGWNFVCVSQAFRWLAVVMVAPAAASLLFVYPLAKLAAEDNQWGYFGLMVVPPLVQILLTLPIIRRLGWLREVRASLGVKAERSDYTHFFRMYGTVVLGYFTSFLVFAYIPPTLLLNYGPEANGFFRVAWTLGIQNLSVLLGSIGSYLYPVLSGAKTDEERKKLLDDAAVILVMLALPMIAGLILFQPLVIRILFASDFLPAIDMLHWLLLANYLKVIQWLFANVSTSRAHMTIYTVGETGLYLGLLVIGGIAVTYPAGTGPVPWLSGIEGIGFAFFLTYVVTTIGTVWATWWRYGYFLNLRVASVWFLGLLVILLCEALTWRERTIDWPVSIGMSVVACVVPLLLLDKKRRGQARELYTRLRSRFAKP